MRSLHITYLLIVFCVVALTNSQADIGDAYTGDMDQQHMMQQQQYTQQQYQKEQRSQKLSPWVQQQFQAIQGSEQQMIELEEFNFQMKGITNSQFKWNPSKTGSLFIKLIVYELVDNQVLMRQNPSEDQYLQIQIQRYPTHYVPLSKVYTVKVLPIVIDRDYIIIRIAKKFKKNVLVSVGLESNGIQFKSGVKDDGFQLPAEQLQIILTELEETEKRHRHTFLNEYSLEERENRHQSEMLVLTGVEMLAILGSCIVQMYSIKSLIDNRAIV